MDSVRLQRLERLLKGDSAMTTLNINPQNKKMILSIDGGGMRGMITVAMLAELEDMTGKPCYELFDLVAGTSTGSIIAGGIGLGLTANFMLEEIYRKRLPNAFRSQSDGILKWIRYVFNGLRYMYSLKPFIDTMSDLAANKTVFDLGKIDPALTYPVNPHDTSVIDQRKPTVLMTTTDVRTSDTYYIVSQGPGAKKFASWPVAGAIGASGAAPIYFPPVLGNFVDGGVGVYGNPCLAATIEAMEYIGKNESRQAAGDPGFVDDNVIHFSFGTGYTPGEKPDGAARNFWLKDWVEYIIFAGMGQAALQQVLSTRAIYGKRIDFRRYNPYLKKETVEAELGISLKDRPDPSKLSLDSADEEAVRLMEEIGRAYARTLFKNQINGLSRWEEPGYMPWKTVLVGGEKQYIGQDGGHPLPNPTPEQTSFDSTRFFAEG
jgi:hypothetical protein